jgi:hypothetical protein
LEGIESESEDNKKRVFDCEEVEAHEEETKNF